MLSLTFPLVATSRHRQKKTNGKESLPGTHASINSLICQLPTSCYVNGFLDLFPLLTKNDVLLVKKVRQHDVLGGEVVGRNYLDHIGFPYEYSII